MSSRKYGDKININTHNVQAFYDDRARRVDELGLTSVLLGDANPDYAVHRNLQDKENLFPKLNIKSTDRVLDIGCGIGRWADIIIPHCKYYCGVDFSSEMINTAKKRQFIGGDYDFYPLSFQEVMSKPVTFFGGVFNVIIITGVCMYINDEELKENFIRLNENFLDDECLLIFGESIGLNQRLTLSDFPSETLKTAYNVIYRMPQEYINLYNIFYNNNFNVIEQSDLSDRSNIKGSETGRWHILMKRG